MSLKEGAQCPAILVEVSGLGHYLQKEMRTYRLEFSEDPNTMHRRIQKARSSASERLLCRGFRALPPRHLYSDTIWAKEEDITTETQGGWDEYHWILKHPTDLNLILQKNQKDIFVIRNPLKEEIKKWTENLRAKSSHLKFDQIFFEISPWDELWKEQLNVHETAAFLYELKHHFPNWNPKPRQGVDLWDARIRKDFELEPTSWNEKKINFEIKQPEISVIIPTFNNKFFLSACLRHLEKQSLESTLFEVLVIDDGGSDESLAYLEVFNLFKRLQIRYIYWPRPQTRFRGDGFYRAGLCRNLGVTLSRSEKIFFLDSDMLAPETALNLVAAALDQHQVVQFPRFHIQQNKSRSTVEYTQIQQSDLFIEESDYWKAFFETKNWMSMNYFWKYTCTYGLAVWKKDFIKAGRFQRTYVSYGFEDTELGYRLAAQGCQFQLNPLPFYHLTSYSSSEYQHSKIKRFRLLSRTAKQFFLNTLDLEVYHLLQNFMGGENRILSKIRKVLGFRDRNKSSDSKESVSV